MPAKVVTVLPWQYTMNLHSIFCKFDANSNNLSVLREPHSSFRFQYRLLTMTTLLGIAVYHLQVDGSRGIIWKYFDVCIWLFLL